MEIGQRSQKIMPVLIVADKHWQIQSIVATLTRSLSAGDINPKVLRGRWFRRSVSLFNSFWE